MTEEEREHVLAEARQNIDPRRQRAERDDLVARLLRQPVEDANAKWKREAEREAERRRRERNNAPRGLSAADVDRRIAAALGEQRRFLLDVVAQTLGKMVQGERKALQQAIAEQRELKIEVAKLTSLVATLREELASERGRTADRQPVLSRTRVN